MFIAWVQGFAEELLHPAVQELVQTAFEQKTESEVRQFFEKNMVTLPNRRAHIQALTLLAAYEYQCGNYSNAAACYERAVVLDPTECKYELLLDAMQAFLCGGEYDRAGVVLHRILADLTRSSNEAYRRRAAVYKVWLLLAEDGADTAVPLITEYINDASFAVYHPALLFTLWWISGNEKIKERLQKSYPSSIEAAAVTGTVTLYPSTFWYLMPKGAIVEKGDGNVSVTQDNAARASYYQIGFYKTKRYAQALVDDLRKKHFTPIIKEEVRPSGTLYFAVLVQENESGTMGILLKNAGYEAFPVFP